MADTTPRAEIEALKADAANDAGSVRALKQGIDQLCGAIGVQRGADHWPEFMDRVKDARARNAALEGVMEAGKEWKAARSRVIADVARGDVLSTEEVRRLSDAEKGVEKALARLPAAPAGGEWRPGLRYRPELAALIGKAEAAYQAMTPEQQAEHDAAQRESFVRGNIELDRLEKEEGRTAPPPASREGDSP